jgi:hypothetical protein
LAWKVSSFPSPVMVRVPVAISPAFVDQDVDPRVPGCQLPGELANLIEMREVGDVPIRAQFAATALVFAGRSPDHHRGAEVAQRSSSGGADAIAGAGHPHRAVTHRWRSCRTGPA